MSAVFVILARTRGLEVLDGRANLLVMRDVASCEQCLVSASRQKGRERGEYSAPPYDAERETQR